MYNNLQNEAQFLKKNEVYSNIGNSTSKQQEGQIIKNIDLVTLKTGTDKDVEDLKKAASGHTVKKAVDKLVQDINKEIVSILNTELQTTRAKNQSLKDIIGDSEAGLVKDLKDLKEQVNSLMPEEAPPLILILLESMNYYSKKSNSLISDCCFFPVQSSYFSKNGLLSPQYLH